MKSMLGLDGGLDFEETSSEGKEFAYAANSVVLTFYVMRLRFCLGCSSALCPAYNKMDSITELHLLGIAGS
jgi:hypothetical protein